MKNLRQNIEEKPETNSEQKLKNTSASILTENQAAQFTVNNTSYKFDVISANSNVNATNDSGSLSTKVSKIIVL